MTGAKDWTTSGQSDKSAGVEAMKAASANRDPQKDGFGKAEELAGKAVGCEGMEKEGGQSKKVKLERQSKLSDQEKTSDEPASHVDMQINNAIKSNLDLRRKKHSPS